ncbi:MULTISPECIES: penicillin acylase family protein [unclassified Variovorax]|uniref:penicillin acylase family protein n=1 Tax=unclassified Variovorax TaxID=663243 RepID=UPI0008C0F93D|nr:MULTISPECIES: penicillin acylase family protein [unclassified Variovorax]SEK12686.1 acyl-homoserine-lactone acylase [Variovorax sp. OK202]SFD82921.1 acyl-homoserine-lactone acylase [Variovorax sp. OK212]
MRAKSSGGLRPLFLVPVVMALAACAGTADRQASQGQGPYKAEIRRTAMGVPHIKADDWAGAGYGYGYAQAQDNLCTMAEGFLTFRGERSQFFGGDAQLPANSTIGRPKNIDSDFFHRHAMAPDVVEAFANAQPDSIRRMAEGFAAGYNRYVREVHDVREVRDVREPREVRDMEVDGAAGNAHAACRGEAWVRPITAVDIYRRMYATNLAAGYSNFVANIANAVPPNAAAPAKVSSAGEQGAQPFALEVGGKAGVGSNMIGFGTAATGDASPLLFGNPHWYWRGIDRFYQAQITIPGQLDVSGTSFLGVPVILIGFNQNVAWSHTVSAARRFGLYQLQLAPNDPTSYMRDGRPVKMQARTVTVNVKQASGAVEPVTRTLYTSEYGPLLNLGTLEPALAWSQATAFAVRDVNAGNFRTFRTWLRWGQGKSLDQLIAAQREEASIPWVNTVAVGRGSAQAWYADIGAVPNVSPEQVARCTTPAGQAIAAVMPRVPVFDGSRSDCDWRTDADSVQKGAVGPARMPSLLRGDYVANMNDSYWLANPKAPLTGYPAIFGPAGSEAQTFRTRLGHLIAQGLGQGATLEAVERATLGSRAYTAELFKDRALAMVCSVRRIAVNGDPQTKEAFSPPRNADTGPACAALRAWNNTGVASARGAHVWDEFWARALLVPAGQLYAVPFSASDPVGTPRGLKTSAAAQLRQAFGAAVLRVQASGYAPDAPRGDVLFATRNGRRIPLSGGCDNQGYFTVLCSENRLDKGGYTMDGNPNGNSYMQVVRFPEGGVEAHTFLTFSLSDDPASAHNGDYTRAYSEGKWLKVPFSESDIKADAAYRSVTIRE